MLGSALFLRLGEDTFLSNFLSEDCLSGISGLSDLPGLPDLLDFGFDGIMMITTTTDVLYDRSRTLVPVKCNEYDGPSLQRCAACERCLSGTDRYSEL